jgi:hypothetical protein
MSNVFGATFQAGLNNVFGIIPFGTPGPTPEFDPTSFPGCIAWYDANDPTTYASNMSNSSVNIWMDKSPQSNHLDAYGGFAGTPAYYDGQLGMLMAGSGYFYSPSFSTDVANHTIFAVAGEISHVNNAGIVVIPPRTGNDFDSTTGWPISSGQVVVDTSGQILGVGNASANGNAFSRVSDQIFTPLGLYETWLNNDTLNIYVDGNLYFTQSGFTPASTGPSENGLALGSRFIGGSLGSNLFTGVIHEVLVYDNPLQDADRIAVEDYLIAKWGL